MLNISNYWRNANQNHIMVPPHTGLNGGSFKTLQITSVGKDVEKGHAPTVWYDCKLVRPLSDSWFSTDSVSW